MIRSIRYFLLISLLISITLASSVTAIGNYILDKKILREWVDTQVIHTSTRPDKEKLAESIKIARNKLIDDLALNDIYILLFTYPIFGLLIWIIVSLALRSISQVTRDISSRAPGYLEPVNEKNIPIEIHPLVVELNSLLKRLKFAFERNKRFAADAAHELRTPLAAIKTQAQVALKAESPSALASTLHKVIRGVDRSSHVITQLLTLSSLGHEEGLNDIRQIDLHHLVTETAAWLVPLARTKNINMILAPPPPNSMIRGNEIALGILLRNIIDNAIRHTPEEGFIKIAIHNRKKKLNYVILDIMDNGPGIPEEIRKKVFTPFYRMPGTDTQGSGLGLAIVWQIAKLHNAEISLGVPRNGKGLLFSIAFPSA